MQKAFNFQREELKTIFVQLTSILVRLKSSTITYMYMYTGIITWCLGETEVCGMKMEMGE